MNDRRKHYLQAMGVEQWSLRRPRPAPQDDNKEATKEATTLRAVASEDVARTDTVLRTEKIVRTGDAALATATSDTNRPSEINVQPQARTDADAPVPQFYLCFLDYEGLSLLFSLPLTADTLPVNYRHFADDIYFALRGERAIPAVRELRWPMVQSAQISQTQADATDVVLQKLKRCAELVLVFGHQTASYCGDLPATREDKKQLIIVEEVQTYFTQSGAKQSLWALLSQQKSIFLP
ncbi:MAG: DNA polymerase III subunit psi [Pseudomonadales bacterium]|nr:DNA polymerase III subunit psi [Pseudomonadales bacterium]